MDANLDDTIRDLVGENCPNPSVYSYKPPHTDPVPAQTMYNTKATTEMTGRHSLPAHKGDTAGTRESGASTGEVPSIDYSNRANRLVDQQKHHKC